MRSRPAFIYSLPSRAKGSFGPSSLARLGEALTLTWFRFELFLVWLLGATALALSPPPSAVLTAMSVLFSPIAAIFMLLLLKTLMWVAYFVPRVGVVAGWMTFAFYSLFSRLIVQSAPEAELPFWGHK